VLQSEPGDDGGLLVRAVNANWGIQSTAVTASPSDALSEPTSQNDAPVGPVDNPKRMVFMDVSEPSGNRAENVMFTAFREESTSRFEAGRVNSGVGSTATRAAATLAAAVIDAAPTLALPVQSVSTRQAAN
jgi:hypothetical protein